MTRKPFNIRIDGTTEIRLADQQYSEEIAALVASSFESLNEWLPWVNENYGPETTVEFFGEALGQYDEGTALPAVVFVEDKVAGGVGLNSIDKANKSAEVGYWLGDDYTRQGLMSRCCKALIDHAFDVLGLHRIVIRCAPGNTRSQAIPRRLGFTEEGTLREAEKLHDRYIDLKVFSLLEHER